jgi:OmpA-OmpF porin, OOP family
MKKLSLLSLVATAALVSAPAVFASGKNVPSDNWHNAQGIPWKNAFGDCWRSATWTPATAAADCDGAIKAAAPAPAPVPPTRVVPNTLPPAPAPGAAPVPPPAPPAVVAEKVTFAADAFFDFNKAVLKPEGKAKLDDLSDKVKGINLEVIIAVGHTDSIGGDAYNQKLSVKRSEAVKAYLISKGMEANRIYTEGKGEKQPVADNTTDAGRAKNRRVEIEVVGTRTRK